MSGDGRRVRGPHDAFSLFAPLLSSLRRERVAVAYLRDDWVVLHVETIAEGCAAAAALPAAAILRGGIVRGATGLILAHNHPSGDARPSLADIRATRRLAAGAAAIGIRLVDHVVLAAADARSFRLMGLI